VRRIVLLRHEDRPVGICIFAAPALSLSLRNRFFALKPGRDPRFYRWLNTQLWLLARVVLHPDYRGAGLAADFVRQCCRACPVPWIETLAALGHLHPFFEHAGFERIGTIAKDRPLSARQHQGLYGGCGLAERTIRTSRSLQPVYYLFDNRPSRPRDQADGPC
jgi:hypothetical protein